MDRQTTEPTSPTGVPHTPGGGFNTATATAATEATLSDALMTLRKRKWVLIASVILGMAYGSYDAITQPRLYESHSHIQVRSGASNEYKVSAVPGIGSDTATKMNTEIAIMKSDTLLLTVARELNLPNNPDFLGAKGKVAHQSIESPSVQAATLRTMTRQLVVTLVPKTEIINVSYTSLNPKLSADIVNKVVSDYIQRSFETRFQSQQRVSAWLQNQLDGLKQEVETSQEQMMDLQKRLGTLGFDPKDNQTTSTLEDLSKASGSAHIARILAESRYRMLNGMDPGTVDGTIDMNPGTVPFQFAALRGQLATSKATYAQMMTTLGPNNPKALEIANQIKELEDQLASEQKRLLIQTRETYLATRANEQQTAAALEQQKTDAYKLRDDLVEYTLKAREYDTTRTLYDGLVSRLRTASVQAGLESTEIDVVDLALVPVSPRLQPYSTVILTMSLFALLLGLIVAFTLESLDTGLRSIAEIESVIELPSLAIIPKARRTAAEQIATLTTAQRNINVLTQPKSQFSESFRALRTSLLLSSAGHPPKFILFTSATPSEGKTTTACNLACILAQRDTRVLLIDADLRRPNVHHRFGLSGKMGLSTLLTGTTGLEESIQRIPEVPNLDIMASGPVPPFPTEMLSSAAMTSLLDRCATLYTHVVIDSPPILSVTDGVILARQADAVVLVVRHGKSSKQIVRRARDLLIRSGAPITGLVLNAVDLNSPEYYGYYGYSGYSYTSIDSNSWESQKRAEDSPVEGKNGR